MAIWGAAPLWTPSAISLRLRATTAASWRARAHVTVNGARLDDATAWVVNAGLLLAALVLAGGIYKPGRRPIVQADMAR